MMSANMPGETFLRESSLAGRSDKLAASLSRADPEMAWRWGGGGDHGASHCSIRFTSKDGNRRPTGCGVLSHPDRVKRGGEARAV